jgi:hypothetical protein
VFNHLPKFHFNIIYVCISGLLSVVIKKLNMGRSQAVETKLIYEVKESKLLDIIRN